MPGGSRLQNTSIREEVRFRSGPQRAPDIALHLFLLQFPHALQNDLMLLVHKVATARLLSCYPVPASCTYSRQSLLDWFNTIPVS